MEIKTKLDLGDAVYFMSNNKVASGKIISIKIISKLAHPATNSIESKTHIVYFADTIEDHKYIERNVEVHEKFAFGTKKELLESLWKNI